MSHFLFSVLCVDRGAEASALDPTSAVGQTLAVS
jgi:hypothetical protein